MKQSSKGWTVAFAGMGINLALGVLYSWSVIGKALSSEWGWSAAESSLPYSVAIGTFALTMIFAGRLQDKLGPRLVVTAGGAMTGGGLIIASFGESVGTLILGFGILAGAGFGLGYAAVTPAAVKWFPLQKKGLITGIVVSGFGLASVYIAPLTNTLLSSYGIRNTFLILGVAFLVVTLLLAQLIQNPPSGYVPAAIPAKPGTSVHVIAQKRDFGWREMVRTPQFYQLWFMYAFASFAGLMIIGHMAKIAAQQLPGINFGFIMVAILAIFNASGRIVAGFLSDRFGRVRTMAAVFLLQAGILSMFPQLNSTALLLFGSALVGFNYGANLSVFPATTADYFGTRNLGVNYGLVFTAWGVGGVFGGMTAGRIFDATGNYKIAFYLSAALCVLATVITFFTKAPRESRGHGNDLLDGANT
ncbi:MAG: oxalate:formate antiporter [Bdellovibrionales bacterium GWB1_55_8]|nr:MAG: oxalate:formate antiporter [Bdellovibrionales bacterium GWB1_55_8]